MEVFIELEQKNQFVWKYERLQIAKENKKKKSEDWNMEMKNSESLISDYTRKLLSSRLYGTGAKTEI